MKIVRRLCNTNSPRAGRQGSRTHNRRDRLGMNRTRPFAFVRELATRWDLIAVIVVIGLLVFAARPAAACWSRWRKLQGDAAVARSGESAVLRRPHDAAHVRGAGAVAGVHAHLRHLGRQERRVPKSCWCRFWTFCSRCRSSGSSRSRWCSSCRWCPGACWAPSSPPFSRFSPARPGTWPSVSISRCARCRTSCTEAADIVSPDRLDALLAARSAVRDCRR